MTSSVPDAPRPVDALADLAPAHGGEARQLAAVQRPVTVSALNEPASAAAWQTLPSWDVIGTKDTAIPPAAQIFMAKRAGAVRSDEIGPPPRAARAE